MNRLLVVCTANLVRSPFTAAALTRSIGDHCEIDSAGVAATDGEQVPLEVLQDMRRYVLNLAKHRSRRVTRDDVRESTLILAMTEAQRDALQTMVPGTTTRIFTLSEFVRLAEAVPPVSHFDGDLKAWVTAAHRQRPRVEATDLPDDIEDPLGVSAERTRACIDRLADLAERLAKRFD